MGRRPSVFVRSVTADEGRRLQRISRTAKDPVKLRRAIVVLMSARWPEALSVSRPAEGVPVVTAVKTTDIADGDDAARRALLSGLLVTV